MKKKLLLVVIVMLVALTAVVPAFAHGAPPCNDSGDPGNSDYARHHISFLAKQNGPDGLFLGGDAHVPGSHQGFSVCNPSGS